MWWLDDDDAGGPMWSHADPDAAPKCRATSLGFLAAVTIGPFVMGLLFGYGWAMS